MHRQPLPDRLWSRPFTIEQARAAGVGRGTLRGSSVRRLFSGVYIAADLPLDVSTHVEAALLGLPGRTVATGVTALWLFGVEIGEPRPLRFLSAHPHQVRRPGLVVTRTTTLPRTRGRAVSPEHAFVAAAPQLNLVELVSAGDWLVRRGRCSPESLGEYALFYRGPGAAVARRAATYVRPRVDSPQETRLRMCVVLAGLPEPQTNVVLGPADRPFGRVDLLLEDFKLILEYEGDQHRTDRDQWNLDIDRVEAFDGHGYRTVRVTAAHLRAPRVLVRRIHTRMVAGGYCGPPPTFTREWCLLFERFAR